ncbi:ANTAR domain-containing protein [Actinoplanes oblitus]|uniref:ANTAR domain-containing protein n=1 Tax=Actinoplanes oblitus TaxID=3040509 RepID=A0ABY8W6Y4_9ACTN|nr:ANTAR domain-containing protein [Actinoplanes oblitus]WIM93609.1 ANTAR domain-containing protein [Actinoplanes oblitus]
MTEPDGPVARRDDIPPDERRRRADLWEASADERERLADERERLADERESLADQRERIDDRHEQTLDRREPGRATRASSAGQPGDDDDEAAATLAAVRQAEMAVRRAEAELERTRQAAARVRARADLRLAGAERAATARDQAVTADAEESAWLADRRDFVAAEREVQAAARDDLADRREEAAGQRERLADQREYDLLDREHRLDRLGPAGRQSRTARSGDDPALDAKARAAGQRQRAAASRRAAAHDRAEAARVWGPQTYGPMLLASFAPLARQLLDNDDLSAALTQVLKFTVEAVAGCDYASITLVRHGRVVDTVTSDADAAELDDVQFATGIGPAVEAMSGVQPVHVPDLSAGKRWPVLAATAVELGVCSALSFGLYVHRPPDRSALGAFTLYASAPGPFGEEDHDFGSILAAYLSVAAATAQRRDEVDRREAALHRGLSTRDVIGQAKGILMERERLSAGEAFDRLRRVSQRLNRKLTDVAQHLAETGELPA